MKCHKVDLYRGVCDLHSSQVRADLFSTVPVEEVWGIGGASAAKLAKIGVQTPGALAALDPDNARALMTVTEGAHGLPAARDLLPAAGADGAHQEGNYRIEANQECCPRQRQNHAGASPGSLE